MQEQRDRSTSQNAWGMAVILEEWAFTGGQIWAPTLTLRGLFQAPSPGSHSKEPSKVTIHNRMTDLEVSPR